MGGVVQVAGSFRHGLRQLVHGNVSDAAISRVCQELEGLGSSCYVGLILRTGDAQPSQGLREIEVFGAGPGWEA